MSVKNLLMDRCPHCGKGKVFPTSLLSFNLKKMNNECPVCHMDFQVEPGFYWGAMYVSYALNIAEFFITYFICRVIGTGIFDWINLAAMIAVVLILSPFNFRLARLIWLYSFSSVK